MSTTPAQHYAYALDSVNLINAIVADDSVTMNLLTV
jgi:hypothetical protein